MSWEHKIAYQKEVPYHVFWAIHFFSLGSQHLKTSEPPRRSWGD